MKKLLSILPILLIFFSSCSKELNTDKPEQNKILTIQVKTEGILISNSNMKSLDISKWIYQYNTGSYNLVFTGKNKTYTFSKSIQELQSGFSVNVAPDTYTITYQSIKQSVISSTADININQNKSVLSSGDLTLTATNSDFLVIFDINSGELVSLNSNALINLSDNIFYGYCSLEGDYTLNYRISTGWKNLSLTGLKINNIYHIIQGINGNSTINILPFAYNTIVL